MEAVTVEAEKREAGVRNIFRKSVEGNFIPAVIYNKKTNIPIRIKRDEFSKQFSHLKSNTLYDIKLEGKTHKAFVKDYSESLDKQKDLQHVDFYLIDPETKIKINVPIEVEGLSVGVTKGGFLEKYAWDIEVKCNYDKIPQSVKVDITHLEIGNHVYVRDLDLGEGVEILESMDKAIVAVMMTSKGASEQDEIKAAEEEKKVEEVSEKDKPKDAEKDKDVKAKDPKAKDVKAKDTKSK